MPPSSLLASLLKKAITSSSLKLQSNFDKIRPFSSLTSATHNKLSFFSDDEGESAVYNHALKFQRPSTIKYGRNSVNNHALKLNWPSATQYNEQPPPNSVSFIGTVVRELRKINYKRFGVHTMLKVKAFPHSKHGFMVLLTMWDEMAEVSIKHLKPDDFIYVWGHLGSYRKVDKNGNPRIYYKVIVKEINYVAESAEKPMYQEAKKLDLQGEDYLERRRNRLHLWQVFFANPYEWKDLRKSKTNPKQPDFKNTTTGEALWLYHSDPPWINKQLQFLDSAFAGQSLGG